MIRPRSRVVFTDGIHRRLLVGNRHVLHNGTGRIDCPSPTSTYARL
jgi:hypothetical protein